MTFINSQLSESQNLIIVADSKLPETLMSHRSRFVMTTVKNRPKFKFNGDALSCIKA